MAARGDSPDDAQLAGPQTPESAEILTPRALSFLAGLSRTFGPTRKALLRRREAVQFQINRGILPQFLPETERVRRSDWKVSPVPADLQCRRVEITGPASDVKMVINAFNSGADCYMADAEDAASPTWDNLLHGQVNLRAAARRRLILATPDKEYTLNEKIATLLFRPRGWHLTERHVLVDGEPMPASLFDAGLHLFHNAQELLGRKSGPYLYLPKLESHVEAKLWNDVFKYIERVLDLPPGCIKATVLIETILAAFEMDEILYELREHSAGLNAGRWDYVFSFIKKFHSYPQAVFPDRDQVTMATPCMEAYAKLLVRTCHRSGAHAMGGMSAFIPVKGDDALNAAALAKVRADKEREAKLIGHDGCWVAHPALVPVAMAEFQNILGKKPHQIGRLREDDDADETKLAAQLLEVPTGAITEAGLRKNLRIGVQYLEAWLGGRGAVAIENLMEDAATAEISRTQIWQWIHHRVKLQDGRAVTAALIAQMISEEREQIRVTRGPTAFESGHFHVARQLFEFATMDRHFDPFLTVLGYEVLDDVARLKAQRIFHPRRTAALRSQWDDDPRWKGIKRLYAPQDVLRVRGTFRVRYTIAYKGSKRLWQMLHTEPYVPALGALTGNQAVQMVRAGLPAIYLSGWQVAGDNNLARETYPDQSLYPVNSVPMLVTRLNNALRRADEIQMQEGTGHVDWIVPIVADAEAGFGGVLNVFELMKTMIDAGASGVHFEDQLAAEKKCGHLGGKVLVPTSHFIRVLTAARLAADVCDVPTILVARTDAESANLLTSNIDPLDKPFLTGEVTSEGYYRVKPGVDAAIARLLAYAPYADMLWVETQTPDLDVARRIAQAVHAAFPGKLLAYNLSPSFNWAQVQPEVRATIQQELGQLGFKFQFVTLAGWHALNFSMYELACAYKDRGMAGYFDVVQGPEFENVKHGYTAVKHQREVGAGYFDAVKEIVDGGSSSTSALKGSTEEQQF